MAFSGNVSWRRGAQMFGSLAYVLLLLPLNIAPNRRISLSLCSHGFCLNRARTFSCSNNELFLIIAFLLAIYNPHPFILHFILHLYTFLIYVHPLLRVIAGPRCENN